MTLFKPSRRKLLGTAAGLSGLMLAPSLLTRSGWAQQTNSALNGGRPLFTLGVASGDPLPDGLVLWTRLAPDPLDGGGMGPEPVDVAWEIATDDKFQNIVRKGVETATAEYAHSLHVEVDGLEPARWYWYRFHTPKETSRVGRTRTAPAPGVMAERLRFALACCQDYSHGYYIGHRKMNREDNLDLVVFVGDYVYEGYPEQGFARRHNTEPFSLEEWRNRHALYKTDLDLQESHALRPWTVTWDDHEVDNDYAGLTPSWDLAPERFLFRRTNAYRAYYEHMPLRRMSIPQGKDMRIYRPVVFGGLVEFDVLDTRQYRDPLACQQATRNCVEHLDPKRSIMGFPQEEWLFSRFKASQARWNIIAEQVPLVKRTVGAERGSSDKWDGYVASRNRTLQAVRDTKLSNPVVLSGDIHQAWSGDLKADFDNPKSAVIGSEFISSSMTSGGDGQRDPVARDNLLASLPHMKFANGKRGWVSFDLTPDALRATYRGVDSVTHQDSDVRDQASFIIEAGRPGLQKD